MERTEEPSSRHAAIMGILLSALTLLIGLALISYSPLDEANTDVSFRDLFGLLQNNDQVRAKLDTTHNWLGLTGALIADFFIHDSFGYASGLILLMFIWWTRDLFRQATIDRATWHKSTLLILTIAAIAFWFGSVRRIASGLPIEWCGLVGEFLSTIVAGIAGTLGSLIISTLALFFSVVFVTDISLVGLINRCRSFIDQQFPTLIQRVRHPKESDKQSSPISSTRDNDPFHFARSAARRTSNEPRIVSPDEAYKTPTLFDLPQVETIQNKTLAQRNAKSDQVSDERSIEWDIDIQPTPCRVGASHHKEQLYQLPLTLDETIIYTPPTTDLLIPSTEEHIVDENELKANARILQEKLETFKIKIENVTVIPGPVITQYEFVPAAGVKISQIEALADDIALALKARGIRIIAPIPGKGTVGVEIPNHKPQLVRFLSIVTSRAYQQFQGTLPLGLGKTITGEVYCTDLADLPHLLIAGATGSGKSVGINTIIMSLIYRLHPSQLKFVIIDPKKVELPFYTKLKHHFLAVCPDVDEAVMTTPPNAVITLKALVAEMEQRYDLLARTGQRKISDYNRKLATGSLKSPTDELLQPLPYIVVIIDELADLMMTSRSEVEDSIIRLAQLARAVGIHLVVATQRPSVDVITGLIKANFPARIAYQVASKVDSRTIIDTVGAEQLLGNGDMLFTPGGQRPMRLQNAFITTEEVEAITDFIGKQRGYSSPYMLPSVTQSNAGSGAAGGDFDPLFVEAARIVVHAQQGSTSLLQRRLRIGYSRAARIIDQLEAAGIVGPFDGSKARHVLFESIADLDAHLSKMGL